jgi:hypothetical protein
MPPGSTSRARFRALCDQQGLLPRLEPRYVAFTGVVSVGGSGATVPGGMDNLSVRHEDGTIDVLERGQGEVALDPRRLEQLYWEEIRRATFGVVRFSRGAIRLLGLWPVVLRFGPLVDGRRAIAGGLMARRAGGSIAWRADGEQTSVAVERYAPLLRGPLWRLQLSFHYLVGRRFLARVAREAR